MSEENKLEIKDCHDPEFRIKTVEELNQNWSKYDGIITYFRPDGVIPDRLKSVEEMNKPREKAAIFYGRGGEKYSSEVQLTDKAIGYIKIDYDGVMPEEEAPVEDISESIYSDPQIDAFDSFTEVVDDGDAVDGMSEAQLRIQQAIFGDFEFDEPTPTVSEQVTPVRPTQVSQPRPITSQQTTTQTVVQSRLAMAQGVSSTSTVPTTSVDTSTSSMPMSRAAYLQQQAQQTAANYDRAVIKNEKDAITTKSVFNSLVTYLVAMCVAVVLSLVIVTFVGQKTEVMGDSMNDTFLNEDQLVIDKITYRFHDPERFDIVVFPESNQSNFVKRIIGMPGETVSVEEGFIYINGEMLVDDKYGNTSIDSDHYYRLESPVTLGEDEYFVLGDNRNNSTDSRDYEVGNIRRDQFIGRVVFRIWPFKSIGSVE